MTELNWDAVKRDLPIGSIVCGTVMQHEAFGVFVKLDACPFRGLVQITDFKDEGTMSVGDYPAVGNRICAVVLGFKNLEQQIWLGMKPTQITNATKR